MSACVDLVTAAQAYPFFIVSVLVFVIGRLIEQTLLGIALWRARVVPPWIVVALIAARVGRCGRQPSPC